ncbi:MAG: ATPase [Methanobacteriota archaeon]|nr:MAG: ATPase [Euryarchaeota archaeon]
MLDEFLALCSRKGVSDIHFTSNRPVMVELHGQFEFIGSPLRDDEVRSISRILYGQGNADVQILSGKPINPSYDVFNGDDRFRFRVNGHAIYIDGMRGLQITVRSLPVTPPDYKDIGLTDKEIEWMSPRQGMVLVTGPTGSGKSTTLASVLKNLATSRSGKLITLEAPIEFVYDNVASERFLIVSSEIPRDIPTFARGVEEALRRHPTHILVGESRDAQTIAASVLAAQTGHCLYTTLHTNGVPSTVRRMVLTFPEEERSMMMVDIMETVRCIVSQTLVQKNGGGRVALREILPITREVRDFILDSGEGNIFQATQKALEMGGISMLDSAIHARDKGLIGDDVCEMIRREFGDIHGTRATEIYGD